MAGSTIVVRSYPVSDTATGLCNPPVLRQQILDDGTVTTNPSSVTQSGTTIRIEFPQLISPAEEAQLDALVAAHQGEAFSTLPQKAFSEVEVSDDTGNEIQKVAIDTGPLPSGTYLVGWYQELAVTTTTGSTGSRGRFNVTKNGGPKIERAQQNADTDQWTPMSGSLSLEVEDGETYNFQITFERIGTNLNAARAQRGRITLARLG